MTGVDRQRRIVTLEDREVAYDMLVLATGARHAYFGHDEWESVAPGLKTIDDATGIRRRILSAFEQAEQTSDPEARRRFLTFVVIGAGPTGVEMAGAIAELAHVALRHDFRTIDPRDARIVLVEAGPRVLAGLPADAERMRRCASLERLRCRGPPRHAGDRVRRATASPSATSAWRPRPSSGRPALRPRRPRDGWAPRRIASAASSSGPISPCPAIPRSS